MERKPKFRSRKLDIHKPLVVYRFNEVSDLDEHASVSRALPAMPTGVDKEEEEEHHLQVAITASQLNTAPVYIPTPEATRKALDYDQLYKSVFKMPKNLIRFSTVIEDCVSVPYDMDDLDDDWLKNHNSANKERSISEDQFEMIISHLEKCANEKGDTAVAVKDLDTLKSLPYVASVIEHCGEIVYDYWKLKRNALGGKPLAPMTKPDEGPKSYSDPFVCFRRREIKGQRKTRRSDAQCLEKLRKLRADLESARNLLEMVCKRDRLKRESLILDFLVFEQSLIVEELRKSCDPAELETISHLRPVFDKSPPKVFKKIKVLEAAAASQQSDGGIGAAGQGVGRPRLNAKEKAARAAARANRGSADFSAPSMPGSKSGELVGSNEPINPTQAIMAHIEREVVKRKRLDDEFYDLSEHPSFPLPQSNADFFFEKNMRVDDGHFQGGGVLCRRRIGRGGRIIYDRARGLEGRGGGSKKPFKASSVWSLLEDDSEQQDPRNKNATLEDQNANHGTGGKVKKAEYFQRQLGGFNPPRPFQRDLQIRHFYRPNNSYEAKYIKLLKEPDLQRLNNIAVSNYNSHYLKVTSGISKPSIDYSSLIIQAPQMNALTSAMTNSMGSSIRGGGGAGGAAANNAASSSMGGSKGKSGVGSSGLAGSGAVATIKGNLASVVKKKPKKPKQTPVASSPLVIVSPSASISSSPAAAATKKEAKTGNGVVSKAVKEEDNSSNMDVD